MEPTFGSKVGLRVDPTMGLQRWFKKKRGAPGRGLKVVRAFTNLGGRGVGGSWNLMLSSNLLKSKIPMLRVGGGLKEFDAEFKFAKIQNSHVEGGWGGGACGI